MNDQAQTFVEADHDPLSAAVDLLDAPTAQKWPPRLHPRFPQPIRPGAHTDQASSDKERTQIADNRFDFG
jgi:hypothetical protein